MTARAMTGAQREAVKLAQFYFQRIAESAEWSWDGDNDTEIEIMVSFIIDAAAAPLRGQLDDALEMIRVLDRLRPTCVICLAASADRQIVRGPACTDCAGDPPHDGPDPDRPETWAFGEPPETTGWHDVPDPEERGGP